MVRPTQTTTLLPPPPNDNPRLMTSDDDTQEVEHIRPDAVAPVDEPEQRLLPDEEAGTGSENGSVFADRERVSAHSSPYPDAPGDASPYPDGWGPDAGPRVQYQSGSPDVPAAPHYDPYPQGVVQFDPADDFEPPDDLPPWYEDEYYDDRDWEGLPRRTSTVFRVMLFLAGFAAIVAISGTYMKGWVDEQLDPPGEPGEFVVISVPQGASTNDIVRILGEENVIANGTVFRYYLRFKDAENFQAGEYTFQTNMAVWDVRTTLDQGARVLETFRVTIPEGLRISEIETSLLEQLSGFEGSELRDAFTTVPTPDVFAPGIIFSTEGFLFPDTYELDENGLTNEAALLARMASRFDDVATELDLVGGAAELGLTPYQVLIVASLIEEEAQTAEDRPKIARVIYNRLEVGEPLGIDATIVYALGGDRELSATDLAVDDPYNTRLYAGLPPSPIAAPGRASLEAALHPETGDWFFYVRTDENGPGSHTFAVTAEQFEAAVQICVARDLGCG